ncbi:putative phage abortive infection protein [Tamlana crocina]|uniref:Phage abortive infection protein n=1 Tax=Tamlana crocina TaxID=393006 RepID=A0ABX1DKQ3_9FLAO|nr:putative phage abortive infection protein [Tamlana crocina]NJX16861.1 hypothetical protein [Tamlana crocina]
MDKQDTIEQTKKMNRIIRVLIIVASVLIIFSFVAPALFTKNSIIDFTQTGQIGDTIGGIMNPFIALAGVVLTYLAFYMQYKANQYQRAQFNIQLEKEKEQFRQELDLQKEQFLKNQFESQFYEMMRIHRGNVNDLTSNDVNINLKVISDSIVNKGVIDGIKTFPFLLSEFEFCYHYVKKYMPDLELKRMINEAYGMFWDGVKERDRKKDKMFGIVLGVKHSLNNKILEGNSNQLAHYYRQLFQTVKFVVNQTIFTYEEKRKYIRILRSQLSNEEQTLLLYNWFSGFGSQWENETNKFFTDYRMIHNVFPNMLVDELKLDEIFSLDGDFKKEKGREIDSLFEYQDWK